MAVNEEIAMPNDAMKTMAELSEDMIELKVFGRVSHAPGTSTKMPNSPHALLRVAAEDIVRDVVTSMASDHEIPDDFEVEVRTGDVSMKLAEREVERALLDWVNHFRDGKVKGTPVGHDNHELDREYVESLEAHDDVWSTRQCPHKPVHIRQGRAHVLATQIEQLAFEFQRASEYLP